MDTTTKLELLAAIVEARERTKFGLQSYHTMRDRVMKLEYNMGSKAERAAVNIFYEDVENKNLGPLMEKTTAEAEELFQHVQTMCEQYSLAELDEEFDTLLGRFITLMDDWRPLSDACTQIGVRVIAELGLDPHAE